MKTGKISDPDAIRDMYDAEAESYSKMMDSEMEHPLYADTLGRLKTRVANLAGAIIDAPCGSGHMLSMYHEDYDKERVLYGIDLSPSMVAIAVKRLGTAAEIVVGDIRILDSAPRRCACDNDSRDWVFDLKKCRRDGQRNDDERRLHRSYQGVVKS